MDEYNTKIELFTKKGKIITLITCLCAVALLVLQMLLNIKASMYVNNYGDLQSYRMYMWMKMLGMINLILALVLFETGPIYQVISDDRKERQKLKRYKGKKSAKNQKGRKGKTPALNLTVIITILISALIVTCVVNIVPIIQDINGNSFKTYDGVCTVLSDRVANTPKTVGSLKKVLLNELNIRVKGDTGLDRGEYYAHIVYSEKSKYIVSFSLTEEELQ